MGHWLNSAMCRCYLLFILREHAAWPLELVSEPHRAIVMECCSFCLNGRLLCGYLAAR